MAKEENYLNKRGETIFQSKHHNKGLQEKIEQILVKNILILEYINQ